MLSKLSFLDVLGHTIHFSRVVIGNLHPAHQRSKAPVSPWAVLHFWFWHFIQHGPFDRWEARLLCSADLPLQVAWLAKKGVCVFSWIYSGKNAYALFGQAHHCGGFPSFPVLWRRFESTYWNLFPAILPCFQILFVAFPRYIYNQVMCSDFYFPCISDILCKCLFLGDLFHLETAYVNPLIMLLLAVWHWFHGWVLFHCT